MPRFRAVLEGVESSRATYVRVPASVLATFGGRVRVPVRMKIKGAEHRTTLCDMGLGPMFAKAMKARERRAYDGMSYSHRKEYVQWIEAAKRVETRARRIAVAVQKLGELAERKASR